MIAKTYQFKSKLWQYPGFGGWHFLNLPKKDSAEIKKSFSENRRGFGSLKVVAHIGSSSWRTSIFPSKEGFYLLAVKASVRKKENLLAEKQVTFRIDIEI